MIVCVGGFGDRFGRERMQRIADAGFGAIRFDALDAGPHGGQPTRVEEAVIEDTIAEAAEFGLKSIPLISRPLKTGVIDVAQAVERTRWLTDHYFDHLAAINTGFEGNDRGDFRPPSELVRLINACQDATPITVYGNLANNTGRPALAYTEQAIRAGLRCYGLDLHTYRTTEKPWNPARGSGWRSRAEEDEAWQRLAGGAGFRLACLENGWNQAEGRPLKLGWQGKLGLRDRVQFTEEQQAEFVEWELFHELDELGYVFATVFQERDAAPGLDPSHEGTYGCWRADGTPKPVVERIQYVARTRRERVAG